MTLPSKPWPLDRNKPLTAELLRQLVHYDPESGIVTWIGGQSNKRKNGDILGTKPYDGRGHVGCMLGRKRYYLHRLIWLWMTGEWPDRAIDHRDTDPANNRWSNLRLATIEENARNNSRPKNNTSGFKGVHWSRHAKRWRASITLNKRLKNLGYFDTKEAAAAVYREAAIAAYGEFARYD